jgi:D-glycero-D-manno-heptose 1,7-bisphosphate phosphatase
MAESNERQRARVSGPGRRALFLDKDGTLIHDVPYNVDVRQIRLVAGAEEGLRLLSQAGYRLFVVTNQSGVAEGRFPERALTAVEDHLLQLFLTMGVTLEGFYYCPHPKAPVDGQTACDCRKPLPGLILRAATEHGIDLAQSWMVGDILSDIEAGNRAGCRSVLVGDEPVSEADWLDVNRRPYAVCADLWEAALLIAEDGEGQTAGPPSVTERL